MSNAEINEEQRLLLGLWGVIKFDAAALAHALRSRSLTPIEAEFLAKMLEGKHPLGLELKLKGQGNKVNWSEAAAAYDRLMAIGRFVDAREAEGITTQAAVFDACEEFGISEATIYRDLALYRLRDPVDD